MSRAIRILVLEDARPRLHRGLRLRQRRETLRAVKLNVGGYLKKPFKMQQLLTQINEVVAQKTAERRRLGEKSVQRGSEAGIGLLSSDFWKGP